MAHRSRVERQLARVRGRLEQYPEPPPHPWREPSGEQLGVGAQRRPQPPHRDAHRVRLAAKRMRYLLEPAAPALLHERMRRHVEDLAQLNRAVVALDFSTTQQLADQIASEPKLGRPLQQDATELNSQLPERFFLLQDDLQRSARDLANAAQARDDARG